MVGIEVDLTSAVQTRSSLALRALQGHVPTVSYSISVRACTCAQLNSFAKVCSERLCQLVQMTSPTQMMRHLLAQAPRTMSAPTSVQQATTKVALTPAWRVASSRAVLALLHRVRVASLSKVATWSATVFLVKSACMSAGRAGRQAAHTNVAPTLCWQAAHVHRRHALRSHQPGLRTIAYALLTMCSYLAV